VTDDDRAANGVSRRTMLRRIGAVGAVAWVTPVISSLTTPAFAQSSIEHPECLGASCATFKPCSSSNGDCVCVSSDQGGFCIPGSTQCAPLQVCEGGTSAECPAGSICAVDTCCDVGVCIPISLTGQCPSDTKAADGLRRATPIRASSGAGTIGG
jgi:hypothetical protein